MKLESKKLQGRTIYQPPPPQDYTRSYIKLIVVICICTAFISAEIIGGIISGSIAIISDAFHLITDLAGFILSFVFIHLARRKPTPQVSFGFHRMELIGALGNIFIVWILSFFMIDEATRRIINKEFVKKPFFMLIFALGALTINIIMFFVLHSGEHSHGLMDSHGHDHSDSSEVEPDNYNILQQDKIDQGHNHEGHDHEGHDHKHDHAGHDHAGHDHDDHEGHNHAGHDHAGHDHKHDHAGHNHDDHAGHDHGRAHEGISMKAALFHVIADIIQSIGILIAACIIFFWGSDHYNDVTEWNDWHYCDPIATYIFSILALIATFPIIKNCYTLLMEATPEIIDLNELKAEFQKIDGVIDVHDLHIWDLRPGKTIMIAHILSRAGTERYVLTQLTDLCRHRKIYHSTFQVEEQDKKYDDDYIACHHDIH